MKLGIKGQAETEKELPVEISLSREKKMGRPKGSKNKPRSTQSPEPRERNDNKVHLLSVRATNIKCIREAQIDAGGAITEIRGDAGAGKTSWLKAIESAITGIDPKLIRKGQDNAEVVLVTDQARIERAIRPGKEELRVFDVDGVKMTIAQAKSFLKMLSSPELFNPLEWAMLADGPKAGATERLRKQQDMLLSAIPLRLGIDQLGLSPELAKALDECDLREVNLNEHALVMVQQLGTVVYKQRKGHNANLETLRREAKIVSKPAPNVEPPGFPLESCREKVEEAKKTLAQAQASLNAQREIESRIAAIETQYKDFPANTPTEDEIKTAFSNLDDVEAVLKHDIKDLQRQLNKKKEKIERIVVLRSEVREHQINRDKLDSLERNVATMRGSVDLESTEQEFIKRRDELEAAEEGYNARKQVDEWQAAQDKLEEAELKAAPLDELVAYFRDVLPKKLMGQMDIPIKGMTVEGDEILIEGIPLHHLGTSQMIPIGVKLASMQNPKCGFLCIDRAESLGTEDRKILAQTAQEEGLNLWMTIVDPEAESGPGRIVMENGEPK